MWGFVYIPKTLPEYDHLRQLAESWRPWQRLQRRLRRLLTRFCAFVMIVGLLNFILFVAGTFYLGGDALSGKVEYGKYYFWGYNIHEGKKVYTEVSLSAFEYSKWHTCSILTMWVLMIAAGLIYKRISSDD